MDGVIFHSDRGSGGVHLGRVQRELPQAGCGPVDGTSGLGPGQRRRGIENSTLKVEYVHRHTFATRAEARIKIATWITDFYNTKRRHTSAGGLPPIEFEHKIMEARARYRQEDRAA